MTTAIEREYGWQDRAACRWQPPDWYFPTRRGDQFTEGRELCATCPVRVECLDHAIRHNEQSGVWGGLTIKQRRRLRHQSCSTCRRRLTIHEAAELVVVGGGELGRLTCRRCTIAARAREAALRVKRTWVPSYRRPS